MTYDSVVLADSPTVFLKTDEVSGTSFADSGSAGATGTLTGTHATLAVTIAGEKGVEFAAGDTWIACALASIGVAGSFECILKVYSDTTNANIGYAATQSPSDTGARNLGDLFGNASFNSEGVGIPGAALAVGDYHLVGTQASGGTQRLYVNGVEDPSSPGSYAPSSASGGSLFAPLGVFSNPSDHVAIGKIAFYDGVVLSPTQVAAHFAALGTTGGPTLPAGASVLTLGSFEEVTVTPSPTAPGLTVQPLHIVSPAVPVPTLVNGRPQ